jgi:hypothetical protein
MNILYSLIYETFGPLPEKLRFNWRFPVLLENMHANYKETMRAPYDGAFLIVSLGTRMV